MTRTESALAVCLLGGAGLWAGSANAADGGVPLSRFDLSVVDKQVNPCSDFYRYSCSTWMGANPIPADQVVWSTGSNLQIWNETLLRETMEQLAQPDPKRSRQQQQVGDYWQACIDEANLDRAGLSPIQAGLDRISAMKSKGGMAMEVAHLHQSVPGATGGFNSYDNHTHAVLFGFGPTQDFADATVVVAVVDQGGMGLPSRDYYLATDTKMKEVRQKYLAHVARLFVLSGESPAKAQSDAAAVLRIETALAKAAMDAVARRDPKNVNNIRTLAQVKAAMPSFDWATYLKAAAVPDSKHYLVATPGFLPAVERLLKTEPLDAWKAYLRWWTLHGNATSLSKEFVDASFAFYGTTLFGAEQLQPRWRRCVADADRDLGDALGQAYVARAFSPESKARSEALVKAVEHALSEDIAQLDWMSAATKKAAQAKLQAIEEKIGYPNAWRDYASVNIGRDSLDKNVHAATAFEFQRQIQKIGKPVDRVDWTMTPPTINAYYDAQLNTINFPAGILQPPYFDAHQDDAANFGAIGMVIGHEIVHGFDDQGRKFDGQGNLRDWWTPEDGKQYDVRGQCIVQEYTQDIPELGVKQDGHLTQGEDTADNGGLRIALQALQDTLKAQGKSLDDISTGGVTYRQEFFTAYAFSWCANVRPEFERNVVLTNPHSLPKYRVNNVVSNMAEFQKAFACTAGQPMVRALACRVW
jgi:putative endopeptidase